MFTSFDKLMVLTLVLYSGHIEISSILRWIQAGWSSEQPSLVKGVPAQWFGTGWSLTSLTAQTILWFFDMSENARRPENCAHPTCNCQVHHRSDCKEPFIGSEGLQGYSSLKSTKWPKHILASAACLLLPMTPIFCIEHFLRRVLHLDFSNMSSDKLQWTTKCL